MELKKWVLKFSINLIIMFLKSKMWHIIKNSNYYRKFVKFVKHGISPYGWMLQAFYSWKGFPPIDTEWIYKIIKEYYLNKLYDSLKMSCN